MGSRSTKLNLFAKKYPRPVKDVITSKMTSEEKKTVEANQSLATSVTGTGTGAILTSTEFNSEANDETNYPARKYGGLAVVDGFKSYFTGPAKPDTPVTHMSGSADEGTSPAMMGLSSSRGREMA